MPVPKSVRRAAREGGNIGDSPGGPSAPEQTSKGASSGLFIIEVKSAKLKENKHGPYRSVTGLAADGKMYWAPVDASHKPVKGQILTLKGEFKGTFGGEDGKPAFHIIHGPNYFPDVVSIVEKPEAKAPAKVSVGSADSLLETLESLVKAHGIGKILSVLGDIT